MSEKRTPPKVENAPGLVWRERRKEWVATWQCRTDMIEKGFRPQTVPLWRGTELTDLDRQLISDECHRLQGDMLLFSRGGAPTAAQYIGTLRSLGSAYQTDPDSNFGKLRYKTREFYRSLIKQIERDHADELVADINARLLKRWHEEWTARGVAAAHAYVGMLRTLFGFGFTFLECEECERLCAIMHKMRFKTPKHRNERLTAEQATAIREKAREMGWYSIALAQAFQFECILRQKDVIGEWVPVSEPGISDVMWRGDKWLRGIRWDEIDDNLILRHMTSKRDKPIECNLNLMPMVLDEFKHLLDGRQASGSIIVCETTGLPWRAPAFRRTWRMVADEIGLPRAVKNMDSRAGAITEATEAGADLEHIKHAATHSDIRMTQRYARGGAEKAAGVAAKRVEHRNKK